MKCPNCAMEALVVTDSRDSVAGQTIRRRRKCEACDHKFTTWEIQLPESLLTVGPSGHAAAPKYAAERVIELVSQFGRLSPVDARLLLVIAHKLAGDEVNATISLGVAA